MSENQVAVIGGGASGMMAALIAARKGASVHLFEKKEQLGKKLSVTGNGRCNYSNLYLSKKYYQGHAPEKIDAIIRRLSAEQLLNFFEEAGMISRVEETRLYPATNQAATVLHVLNENLKKAGVHFHCNTEVKNIVCDEKGFLVIFDNGEERFSKVILSAGSPASVKDERKYNGDFLCRNLKFHWYPFTPALTNLTGNSGIEKIWDGVRTDAEVSYKEESYSGEIQFRKDGLSGIPIMQISHAVVSDIEKNPCVCIRFLPQYDKEFLLRLLNDKRNADSDEMISDYLLGWLPKKLILALAGSFPILKKSFRDAFYEDLEEIIKILTEFSYPVLGYGDFSEAHVCQGGVDLCELTDDLESKRIPGLFITGELLDATGTCGGYNLHFAFTTGWIAGNAVTK